MLVLKIYGLEKLRFLFLYFFTIFMILSY